MDLNKEVPRIKTVIVLKEYINPVYVIEKYTVDHQTYEGFITRIQNIVRGCIDIEECREHKVKFKFYEGEKKTHQLELRRFLYNICLWYPFSLLGDTSFMDESFILKEEDTVNVNKFINDKILKVLKEHSILDQDIQIYTARVMHYISGIGIDFSIIMGLHFDEMTFQNMYRDPEFREMMDTEFDASMQPADIEDSLKEIQKKFIAKIKNDPSNPISVLLRCGVIKEKQLVELLIMIALRPALTGTEVIPIPINNGFLINGLNKPSYMFIDALGARKPLLANNKEMGPVGYFCKTLNLATRSLEVSTTDLNCGTSHLVEYLIKSPAHLHRMRGKYVYDEELEDFHLIDHNDRSLIGKRVRVRSAVTCCCGENHVCPTCVGSIMNYNFDIAKGFGVFITEQWSKDLEQNILSTKHLLTTNSEKIEFSDTFNKIFKLDGEEIKLLDEIEDVKDLAISINPDEIQKIEEDDPNSTYNTYIETGRFFIVNRKTGESNEASVKDGKEIYIRTEISDIMTENNGYIPLDEIEEDQPIFEISIGNSSLTKSCHEMISLLDSENRPSMGDDVTIDAISQKFLDILVDANLDVPIAAGEIVLNRLCRKPNNVQKRPNFGRSRLPKYKFYGLTKVVENSASITTGMVFEQLERQFTKLNIDERNSTGFYDPMFKEDIDFRPLHKYREEIEREIEAGTYDD
jgi:hypothetical protein